MMKLIVTVFSGFSFALVTTANAAEATVPEPVVRAMMVRVEAILVGNFPEVAGLSKGKMPPVFIAELHGLGGSFDGTVIKINAGDPPVCFERALAHQQTLLLLGKALGKTPEESEPAAIAVGAIISGGAYMPDCEHRPGMVSATLQ